MRVSTVDYHTAGEPFRIVTGGVEPLAGRTVLDKRRFARERRDEVRRLLVHEPRGHADMYGCFVVEPNDAGADLGVVFFHNEGYSTACGHGTIALVTWALESGALEAREPETLVVVDVPSGRLEAVARVEGGEVRSVRFRNVPAYVAAEGLEAGGLRGVAVAFGGAFYGSVEAPVPVEPRSLPRLIELGRAVKRELEAQREFVHPEEPELRGIYGVLFWEREAAERRAGSSAGAGGEAGREATATGDADAGDSDAPLVQRNVTVFADGEVDRSPCGSGTSARLALLDASGELARGRELLHRGIVGTEFRARVVGDAAVAGLPAVVTEIEGSAHLTGRHEFVLEPDDDLGTGFLLR